MPISAEANEFPHVLLADQAGTPSTPAAGLLKAYYDTDGLYVIDDGGNVTGPFGSGGGGAMVELDSVTLGSAAMSITFSSITGAHTDLVVRGLLRSDRTGAAVDQVTVQVGNGSVDSGSSYDWVSQQENNAGASSNVAGGDTSMLRTATIATDDYNASLFSTVEFSVMDYANAGLFRRVFGTSTSLPDAANSTWNITNFSATWRNTASAIDVVTFTVRIGSNFMAGSTLTLYGIG